MQAWGEWLSGLWPWQWFVTLTFRDPTDEEIRHGYTKRGWGYAKKAFRSFENRLQPALGRVRWVVGLEYQRWRGVPHLHGLIGGLDDTSYAEIGKWYWENYGLCRILDYDPGKGAGYYLSRYVSKELSDVWFSEAFDKT